MSNQDNFDQLIYAAVRNVAPEVVEACSREYRARDDYSILPRSALLDSLLHAKGPESVLTLPAHAPVQASGSTLMFFLLNSPTPIALINKLSEHNKYFHPQRKVRLIEHGANTVLIENSTLDQKPLSDAEALFTCGAVKFILERFGCRGLTISWMIPPIGQLHMYLDQLGIEPVGICEQPRWRFCWERFEKNDVLPELDNLFLSRAEPSIDWDKKSISAHVKAHLRDVITEKPTLEKCAQELGFSARTLQRILASEKTSFTHLCNEVRVTIAENLLRDPTFTLAEVGALSGFSDSSHFSRTFKKLRHLTPGELRRTLLNNSQAAGSEH